MSGKFESTIDHLVVTAPNLKAGTDYIKQMLGVEMHAGGEHSCMATHNCLLKLGEKCYLEVIAANPNAPKPQRPRWFALDHVNDEVRLQTWLARSNNIHQATENSPLTLGDIDVMSRDALQWRITIPTDGSMSMDGIAPALIQWSDDRHPATHLPESGCELFCLTLYHPQIKLLESHLQAIGFFGRIELCRLPDGQKPYLLAQIKTPTGVRQLGVSNKG